MIQISSMKTENIPDAINLWKMQFSKYCYCGAFPNFMEGGYEIMESYIKEQIYRGNAIAAKADNHIVGFMAWQYFEFHNERTAFLPVTGHASSLKDECRIYEEMYDRAADMWVSDNRFNHMWMIYFDDHILKNRLYDLGFGAYVIDACQSTCVSRPEIKSDYQIAFASEADADILTAFANDSNEYYSRSPIFLKRCKYTRDEIVELIHKECVLIAWDDEKMIGVMSFAVNQNFHLEHLTTPDSACIKYIGAYVHPEYRNKGVGTALLREVFAFCNEKGKPYLHVSFESANSNAIRFWPKHFKPAIRSVRRTVNKDGNTEL